MSIAESRPKQAADRVAKAERLVARWRGTADRAAAALRHAQLRGDTARAQDAGERLSRARRHLARHQRTLAKYRPIASMAATAGRIVERVGPAEAAWKDDRRSEAKAARHRARLALPKEGHEGRYRIGAKLVQDPYDGETIAVPANVHESPLEHLASRGHIDGAQKAAGDWFRRNYEASVVGATRAIDPTREAVDGGRIPEPISAAAQAAIQALSWASGVLGITGYAIMVRIAGEGRSIKEVAASSGSPGRAGEEYVGKRFREALTDLADARGTTG